MFTLCLTVFKVKSVWKATTTEQESGAAAAENKRRAFEKKKTSKRKQEFSAKSRAFTHNETATVLLVQIRQQILSNSIELVEFTFFQKETLSFWKWSSYPKFFALSRNFLLITTQMEDEATDKDAF